MTGVNWPNPVEICNADGASDIVLLCEHASNHIPAEYSGLGLTPHDLTRHIAWDLGAAEVTRRLSDALGALAFLGTYSRLLIDLNRPVEAPSSIVTRSEATDIAGNLALDPAERLCRIERIFQPYQDAVTAALDLRQQAGRPTRLVSIHSFTPIYLNEVRPWHAGVLFGAAETFGLELLDRLREPGFKIEANVPYQTSREEDYGVPVHGDDRGIPAVLIELRHDLISDEAGISRMTAKLAAALQ
ncbi:N-formylglutamate amidohydrolase [Asticcacaulis sp. 201]|uniref:N-formylglutamate amidohydrolase n=1 Tax=Asticcacaulis sp. 201 TaxID=3028787 RepID=UPI002916BA1E|nr:N-formylglutamate amidohydrolase [Asticcacaulis sp. 201]MDV6330861.1 N-formylglutamate amidohydrolase [Asticcacaulis sp. 201]